jgi:ABC-type Na+ efflux pump permease subunit
MSYKLTETENVAEQPKKLPYNLREKRVKDAAYRTMIRAELADELYQKIVDIVIVKKKYKTDNDPEIPIPHGSIGKVVFMNVGSIIFLIFTSFVFAISVFAV